jgi:hypothetical protein
MFGISSWGGNSAPPGAWAFPFPASGVLAKKVSFHPVIVLLRTICIAADARSNNGTPTRIQETFQKQTTATGENVELHGGFSSVLAPSRLSAPHKGYSAQIIGFQRKKKRSSKDNDAAMHYSHVQTSSKMFGWVIDAKPFGFATGGSGG